MADRLASRTLRNAGSLAGTGIGGSGPVRVMGIINASPESFMKGSVRITEDAVSETAARMEAEGADFIDIGGMSTAPGRSAIPPEEEKNRMVSAVKAAADSTQVPVSADTPRALVARAALDAGAKILNDVSGLRHDAEMADVIRDYGPSLILCAHGVGPLRGDLVSGTRSLLEESVRMALSAGAREDEISVDPAIGFFRQGGGFFTGIDSDWAARDVKSLLNLREIKQGFPVTVSVSSKSFIGRLGGGDDPAERLPGSLAFEVVSVLSGADIIRTHNVAETVEAVRTAEAMLKRGISLPGRGYVHTPE